MWCMNMALEWGQESRHALLGTLEAVSGGSELSLRGHLAGLTPRSLCSPEAHFWTDLAPLCHHAV